MVWKKHKKLFLILAAVVVVLAIAVPLTVLAVSRAFTAQESAVRTDWGVADVGGEVVERDEALQIEYAEVDLNGGLRVLQLVPMDLEEENFTYYDAGVQQRLSDALGELKARDVQCTASNPLAVLNRKNTAGEDVLYFVCRTYQRFTKAGVCTCHSIREQVVTEAVLAKV